MESWNDSECPKFAQQRKKHIESAPRMASNIYTRHCQECAVYEAFPSSGAVSCDRSDRELGYIKRKQNCQVMSIDVNCRHCTLVFFHSNKLTNLRLHPEANGYCSHLSEKFTGLANGASESWATGILGHFGSIWRMQSQYVAICRNCINGSEATE